VYLFENSGTLYVFAEWDSIHNSGIEHVLEGVGLYLYEWDCIYIRGSGTVFILVGLYMYERE